MATQKLQNVKTISNGLIVHLTTFEDLSFLSNLSSINGKSYEGFEKTNMDHYSEWNTNSGRALLVSQNKHLRKLGFETLRYIDGAKGDSIIRQNDGLCLSDNEFNVLMDIEAIMVGVAHCSYDS